MIKNIILPDGKPLFGAQLAENQYSKNLVGIWPFREAGNLVDYSHLRNHGVITGATWAGQGLSFDGSLDYVDMGNVLAGDVRTVIVRFKLNNVVGRHMLASKWLSTDGNREWLFETNSANLRCFASNTGGFVVGFVADGGTTLVADRWYTAAVVMDVDNTNCTLYLDGDEDGSDSSFAPDIFTGIGPLSIGSESKVANFMVGDISYTSIYNRALSGAEIEALFISPWLPLQQDRIIFAPTAAVTGAVRLIDGGLIGSGLIGGRLIA